MTIRAKFQLQEVRTHVWGDAQTLVFRPQYDGSIPEDQRFYKATPSGEFIMQVNNPVALEALKLGKYYYVDFNEVEKV